MDFPDALAGGVLQGRGGSVMLLTRPASLNSNVATVLANNRDYIAEVRYLGGLNALNQSVRDAVADILCNRRDTGTSMRVGAPDQGPHSVA